MSAVHIRCVTAPPDATNQSEWLRVIWETNTVRPDTFGKPTKSGQWWAGGYVEEYDDARVLHRTDGSTSIVSKTDAGEHALREAANRLGIHCP